MKLDKSFSAVSLIISLAIFSLFALQVADAAPAKSKARARLAKMPVAVADPVSSGPRELDRVLAAIDGEPISMSDLRRFVESIGVKFDSSDEQQVSKNLHDLITLRLLEKEADKNHLIVGSEEVDQYMNKVIEQNNATPASFLQELKKQGITIEQYRAQVRHEILRTRLIQARMRKSVNVVDEDIARFLENHPELKPEQGTVHLEQAFIGYEDPAFNGDKEAVRAQLEKLREEAQGGKDFAKLEGVTYQDLGYLKPADLRPELQSAINDLKVGQISGVVESETGAALIYFTGRADDKGSVVDERIRDRIKQELFSVKMKSEMKEYFGKELPKQYDVEVFTD